MTRTTRGTSTTRAYTPTCERCIRWLLGKAEHGQPLIPLFRDAAARLAQLEAGKAADGPCAEHIAAIQTWIKDQATALLDQPDAAPLARLEAAILLADGRLDRLSVERIETALAAADEPEWITALARLGQRKDLVPWLRSRLASDSDSPPAHWLRSTLARQGIAPTAPAHELAALLRAEDTDTAIAAALALLVTDLPDPLVKVLADAAQSLDDRVRMKGAQRLDQVAGRLATDGSTKAVETLVGLFQEAWLARAGYLGQLCYTSAYLIQYADPYWIGRWLDALEGQDESVHRPAMHGLGMIFRPSPPVRDLLCDRLGDQNRSVAARRAVAGIFTDVMRWESEHQADEVIQSALSSALKDPDAKTRQLAALALQWATGRGAWGVAQALLATARSDSDPQARALALKSAGRLLGSLWARRDLRSDPTALRTWIEERIKQAGPWSVLPTAEEIAAWSVFDEASDSESVLAALAQAVTLGSSEQDVGRLQDSEDWERLLEDADKAWQDRRFWLGVLPELPACIAELEAPLGSAEPEIRRAAACALARVYHGDDDRPARLAERLPNETEVLRAMLDAAVVTDAWQDQGYQGWAVRQIAGWIAGQPAGRREAHIAQVLDDLEQLINAMETQTPASPEVDQKATSFERCTRVALLAELTERLSYRSFTAKRDLGALVSLFARAAADSNSVTRRFAIRALGNLQQLNAQVADALFAAGQDLPKSTKRPKPPSPASRPSAPAAWSGSPPPSAARARPGPTMPRCCWGRSASTAPTSWAARAAGASPTSWCGCSTTRRWSAWSTTSATTSTVAGWARSTIRSSRR